MNDISGSIIDFEKKILFIYDFLDENCYNELKNYTLDKLQNQNFKYDFNNKVWNYELDMSSNYVNSLKDNITVKIKNYLNYLFEKNKKLKVKDMRLNIFMTEKDEEFNVNSKYKNSYSLRYNFSIENGSSTKNVKNKKFYSFLNSWISQSILIFILSCIKDFVITINEIKKINELDLYIIHKEFYNISIVNKNYNFEDTDYDCNMFINNLLQIINNKEIKIIVTLLKVSIKNLLIYTKKYHINLFKNYQKNFYKLDVNEFKQIESTKINKLEEILELDKKCSCELISNDYLKKTIVFYAENIYNDTILCMHNLVDSQGHTRILIPENPIITHLPHSENSCLGYPSYYITKKKSMHAYLDDIELQLIINLLVE